MSDRSVPEIFRAVVGFDPGSVIEHVDKAMEAKVPVEEILNDGLIAAMDEVGRRFTNGEVFVPEMLMAAQSMKVGLERIKPLLTDEGAEYLGVAVIGTVKGDLHDIGKNLVGMMLGGAGFDVIDLGVDVDPEEFVQTAIENQAALVGLSALLTTTMPAMAATVAALKEAGVPAKCIVGGSPVTRDWAERIGADGFADDAPAAVALARQLVS